MNEHTSVATKKMRDSQLLDNGSVSTFSCQQIKAISDELFEIVIYIPLALKLQMRSYSKLQFSSPKFTRDFR
jgi:hypothetical protein